MTDKLLFVSADSHAGMPSEAWPEYLDPRFHDVLPLIEEELAVIPTALFLVNAANRTMELPEYVDAHLRGCPGLHDPTVRLAQMDAEGVAAELIYHGDSRLHDLGFSATNRPYSFDMWHAGLQAWNRWAYDTFSVAPDRFLLTSPAGPCVDMDTTLTELHWVADHGFAATYAPGYTRHAGLPPLYDGYWDPFWATCAERGLPVVVHAGFGTHQGGLYEQLEGFYRMAADAAGSTDFDEVMAHAGVVGDGAKAYIRDMANHSASARRPLWQLTLGGVFDRHPELRLLFSEVRVDWMPATVRHLDGVYEEHRADVPAKRTPSEYWESNCFAVASFIHKAEVEQRHEIGLDRMMIGRDYPHSEGTWPHSREWFNDAFSGVPDAEVRQLFGENAIKFLGLDRARLAAIAERIGFEVSDVNGPSPELRPELAKNFQRRGGYFKPSEGGDRIPMLEPLIREDLAGVARRPDTA